jgi:hypothetical protein
MTPSDRRIADAPRAWAVFGADGTPWNVSFTEQPPEKYLIRGEYYKRVALVELKPEEVE